MSGPMSARELGMALQACGIFSVADLVAMVRGAPDTLADILESEATQAMMATSTVQTRPLTLRMSTRSRVVDAPLDATRSSLSRWSRETVSVDVQCSPETASVDVQCNPRTAGRGVQTTSPVPVRAATCEKAVNTVCCWHDLKAGALVDMRATAREDALAEIAPSLERATRAAEVQAERAAAMYADARDLKCSVRDGFERQAAAAAAAAADRQAAAEDRTAAEKIRGEHVDVIALLQERLRAEKRLGSWS